jgi:hypothetical protein
LVCINGARYIVLTLVLVPIISYGLGSYQVYAESPSFVRQMIIDSPDDWFVVKTRQNSVFVNGADGNKYLIPTGENATHCAPEQNRFPDITAVSYFSDGKSLNATLWLHTPFMEPQLKSNNSLWLSPPIRDVPWYRMFYGMSIGILSAYDIEGSDYQVRNLWDIYDKNWTRIVEEMSTTNERKVLDQKHNDTGFSHSKKGYIDLSLDLRSVTFPKQYNVLFYTMYVFIKDGRLCGISDISNRVYIPPPEYIVSASPNPIELRVGEEEIIELQVKAKTNLRSHALLSTSHIDGIKANFSSNGAYVPRDSSATLPLKISASENEKAYSYTLPHSYTLPILANISIPTESRVRGIGISDDVMKNSISANVTENSNLTIAVLPPLTIPQHLNNIYNAWISPISGISSFLLGVGAVTVPVLIRRYNKKRIKEKNKKVTD